MFYPLVSYPNFLESSSLHQIGKPLEAFALSAPTVYERVRAWCPIASKKPSVLENFPPDLSDIILAKTLDILRRRSPLNADKTREKAVLTAPGTSAPAINKDLLEELPWIAIKYPSGFSDDVIRYFLSAPNLSRCSKVKYRGYIKAKLAGGRNSLDPQLPRVSSYFEIIVSYLIIYCFIKAHIHNAGRRLYKELVYRGGGFIASRDGMVPSPIGTVSIGLLNTF